ncbi:IS1634 family transposase [Acidobacteria bacterium AH-259-O06]|nr:IS1634 family transposase [Acidobacteria bacterium AH-259-G07]MDA2930166.1 IS1634 family transposase [Acidobacteria bacterium AH-259-O06]
MASLTKKKIGGRIYYYARQCRRVEGRPKIVWQKYLGRLEDILAAVSERREGRRLPKPLAEGMVTQLGAVAALYDLALRLDLVGTIDQYVPKRGSGPSVGTYLLVGAINRCVDPRSKARLGAWFDQTVLRRLVEVESRQLTSQRYWDNMERVSEESIRAIEADVAARVVQEFELDLGRLLFDGTNFFTFIDSFNEKSTLAQRGKSKEGRAALRIVGLALLVTADFHVPLFHHTYAGNQNDARTFADLSGELARRCRTLMEGVEHITLIFDKGNNSQDNLEAVAEGPFHFVGSLVPTQHPTLLEIPFERFRSLADEGLPGVWVYRTTRQVFGQQRTVVVLYNENLFVAQAKTLLREIGKRQRRFRELVARLERWRRGEVRGGRAPTLQATRKKVNGWLKARHMKDLFEVELSEQNNLPLLSYQFQPSAWENLQRTLLGKTILFTDNDDWTDAEIVCAYRSQYHIEDAFRSMKDPHHIALRPQFHWTDQKIRVHVFICVIALMLVSLLRRLLHAQGLDLSIPRMLELLADIREMVMLFPPEGARREPSIRTALTAMTAEQRRIYEALNLQRYTSV